jgi:hypothetical protein
LTEKYKNTIIYCREYNIQMESILHFDLEKIKKNMSNLPKSKYDDYISVAETLENRLVKYTIITSAQCNGISIKICNNDAIIFRGSGSFVFYEGEYEIAKKQLEFNFE